VRLVLVTIKATLRAGFFPEHALEQGHTLHLLAISSTCFPISNCTSLSQRSQIAFTSLGSQHLVKLSWAVMWCHVRCKVSKDVEQASDLKRARLQTRTRNRHVRERAATNVILFQGTVYTQVGDNAGCT
jgi:hypothetical protein